MSMSIDEIRSMSAEMLANERAAATGKVHETTPKAITDKIVTFSATELNGKPCFVPVLKDEHGLYGWCSDGVSEKIKYDGGNIVFGWAIWEWSSVMLTAEFHAVWSDAAGNLFDITPKPNREQQIVFVPDINYPSNFNFDERPRNRRSSIHVAEDLLAKVQVIKGALAGGKLRYEEARAEKANLSLDDWLLSKQPVDILPEAIGEVIDACNAYEIHFDSLGTSGMIQADDEMLALMKRREKAVRRLQQLT